MTSFVRPLFFTITTALAAVGHASIPIPVNDLVDRIVAHNPERAFYLAEIDAARTGDRLASRWSNPELSLELGRKRVRGAAGVLTGEGHRLGCVRHPNL
ncbi:MAG: hypothetical protein J6386_01610 [Candidatus Synoicihabitans palmerolidicus]|nr:hypothetical protein [Candidatus Synoicihabitans palmerolidicus]